MIDRRQALLALALLLASPALAGSVSCLTYEEKSLGRLQILCDDCTRGISTYNKTPERWNTTITGNPRKACTGQMNPRTRQVEVRCRWGHRERATHANV
jgi:hypothetical protein